MTLGFDDGDQQWSALPSKKFVTEHVVPVVGMKPNRLHKISAVLTDEFGNETKITAGDFTTPELPAVFPRPHVVISDSQRVEPGVNLFTIHGRWGEGTPEGGFSPAVIVDNEGETLWYHWPDDHHVHSIRRIANGNFLYVIWPGTGGMVEIDLLGNVVRRWHFEGTAQNPAEGSIAVPSDSAHHDVIEIPNGNFLLLSSEVRTYENWYTSTVDADAPRATANVVGDVVIEMTYDGAVVNEWKLLDILDPYRIGHGSLRKGFWAQHYRNIVDGDVYDWSHTNAIIYDESDHSFILSVPFQNAVIKVEMASGDLKWILGTPEGWTAPWADKLLKSVGDIEWPYRHHSISHSGRGTYLLFDNGVDRTSPFAEPMPLAESYSRGVEYAVNEAKMEVSQPWVYGPEQERFYGRYLSDIDWLPHTHNILINVGAHETGPDGSNAPTQSAQRWARFMEVTSDDAREKVWELQLKDDGLGWTVYRVDRIPDIYPSSPSD